MNHVPRSALLVGLGLSILGVSNNDSALGSTRETITRTAGTLTLSRAVLTGQVSQIECPGGGPDSTACFTSLTKGVVPGLGTVSDQNLNVVEDADSSCERWHSSPVLTIAGKGEIDLSVHQSGPCAPSTTGILAASLDFTVTGGSGIYAGASGSGTGTTRGAPGTTNRQSDTFTGTLTVPGLEFDLIPPIVTGALSKTAVLAKKARTIRVTYKVTARDQGRAVPVVCKPPSGSRFQLGRTRVVCSATDSSGNTAIKKFVITVKKRP